MTIGTDIRAPKITDDHVSIAWTDAVTRAARTTLGGVNGGDFVSPELGRLPRPTGMVVAPFAMYLAKIFDAAETDLRDNRYHVRMLDINNGATFTPIDRRRVPANEVNEVDQTSAGAGVSEYSLQDADAVDTVATNLGEQITKSHHLDNDTPILLWRSNLPEATLDAGERWFFFADPGQLVPVWCVNDGGVPGDEFNDCTLTYSVYLWSDRSSKNLALATTVTPQRARLPKTRYRLTNNAYGVVSEGVGFGYYVGTTFTLAYVLPEIPDPAPC